MWILGTSGKQRGFHPCRSLLSSWPLSLVAADHSQRQQHGEVAVSGGVIRGQGVLLWKMLKAVGVPVQEGQEHSSAQNCPERFGHILTTIQHCPICLQKGQTSDNLIFNQR